MLMATSTPQGFGVGLSLADATRSSFWAISWAMLASTRAGLVTTMAYTSALADCRSVEEVASLQADTAQDTLRAAEECVSEMAEATGRLLDDAEAAIKGTDAVTVDHAA